MVSGSPGSEAGRSPGGRRRNRCAVVGVRPHGAIPAYEGRFSGQSLLNFVVAAAAECRDVVADVVEHEQFPLPAVEAEPGLRDWRESDRPSRGEVVEIHLVRLYRLRY